MDKKFENRKRNRVISIAAISSIAVGIIIILLGMILYKNRISELRIAGLMGAGRTELALSIFGNVGSIVCLIGALAGTLIVNKGMNIWLAITICLAVGILIGIMQGFWIAYLRIPAFIVTLAGMLLWRGVALIVLGGLTISAFPNNYLNLFNSYIPDPFGGTINIQSIVVGIVICAIYICLQVFSHINRKKKGYQVDSFLSELIKTIIICVVIMALAYSLANHKGIPTILILLAVVVFAYA